MEQQDFGWRMKEEEMKSRNQMESFARIKVVGVGGVLESWWRPSDLI